MIKSSMATDVLAVVLSLPATERATLARERLRSLDEAPVERSADAWDEEIDRRGAEVEAGTAETMTLAEYRDHVAQRRAARSRR